MSERIRKLEEALKTDHSQLSATEHPLLRQDLLVIKKSPELFGIEQQQQQHTPAAQATSSDETLNTQSRHDDTATDGHTRSDSVVSSRDGDEVSVVGATSSRRSS